MKFKRHTKLEHGLEQIDIAPLIDVINTLLKEFPKVAPKPVGKGSMLYTPEVLSSLIGVILMSSMFICISFFSGAST